MTLKKISGFHYFTGTLLIVLTQLNFHVAKLYGRSSSPFFSLKRNRTTKHTESLLKYFYCQFFFLHLMFICLSSGYSDFPKDVNVCFPNTFTFFLLVENNAHC